LQYSEWTTAFIQYRPASCAASTAAAKRYPAFDAPAFAFARKSPKLMASAPFSAT